MTFERSAESRDRHSRWPKVVTIVGIAVVAAVIAFFAADAITRSIAQAQIGQEIRSNLPSSVSGDVGVTIGGASVIAQYLQGSFSRVDLSAPHLSVEGNPLAVSVVGTEVPTDLSKPVGNVHGTLSANAATVNSFIKVPGSTSDLTLGSGTVSYHGNASLFGVKIGYEVTVKPIAQGKSILLEPTSAKLTSGGFGFDVSKPLTALLGANPPSICVAQYLPAGVAVTGITIVPSQATVQLDAPSLVLSAKALNTKGQC